MRTRASFQGHPIHPMLIHYPLAFLTGGWAFGVAAATTRNRDLNTVSRHLIPAGVATGLLAAVPGIIDYLGSVPPRSSGQRRARTHALLNTAALALYSAGWLLGRRRRGATAGLMLQGVATAALARAAWHGGVLIVRNQIGVDHRYANAGKWQEETRESSSEALALAGAQLELNQMKLVHADTERIAVGRTERGCAAFDDRCTHRGGSLADGTLINGIVQCPWHGSQFDVHTGDVKCGPATEPIKTHGVVPLPREAKHA